jgi:hypothetical protein
LGTFIFETYGFGGVIPCTLVEGLGFSNDVFLRKVPPASRALRREQPEAQTLNPKRYLRAYRKAAPSADLFDAPGELHSERDHT